MTQTFKIKLAAIAKDEGFYLPLWVYHHLLFGFDVLDIRINGTTDNSWQILEKLKVIYGDRLRFSYADRELEECRAKDINFQVYIYTKIYQETLVEDFTHLMFLDIDEYWCSTNFSSNIKDFLTEKSDFDVCMFQWLMEVPNNNRQIDDFPFKDIINGQKNDHVKSLLNIKSEIKAIRVHNVILKKGKYILPDRGQIDFSEQDRSRGVLPTDVFEACRKDLANYFVYHQIFRSQDEYISSLLRGNKQNGDDSLLKTNRFGFVSNYDSEFNLTWSIQENILAEYQQGYNNLTKSMESDMELAKQAVLARRDKVLSYLTENSLLQDIHKNKMSGISPAIYHYEKINYPIQVKVKSLAFDEAKNCCRVICVILTEELEYSLMVTQSFNRELIDARIHLIEERYKPPRTIKRYEIEVDIDKLVNVIYRKAPPFCLAATINGESVLLERAGFHSLGEIVAKKASQLRKTTLEQQPLKGANLPVQNKQAEKNSFWRNLFRMP